MSKIRKQRCLSSQFTPFAKNTNMNIKYEISEYKTYVKEWKFNENSNHNEKWMK